MSGHAPDLDVPMDSRAASLEVSLLRQAAILLEGLPDSLYTCTTSFTPEGTVGRHVRHCVDFFERFLDGLPTGRIDYSARRRSPAVESSRSVALTCLADLEQRLATHAGLDLQRLILVRPEDDDSDPREPGAWFRSSIGRELRFLASHTVHHFALIAVLLRTLGHPTDSEFGVAPSTLRRWSQVGRPSQIR
jgi:uncharacterized damage-inducible protein DinB